MTVIRIFVVIASAALAACSSSAPTGRLQLTAPTPLSAVYSEVNMQLSLVTEANTHTPCFGHECELNREFEHRVLRVGTRLAQAAFAIHPELHEHIDKFEFIIAEKSSPGSLSNSAGSVVIFRGVQQLQLGEEALAFLIAREMGHIIAHHHEENSATSMLFSVLAAVFIPVTNLLSGSAAVAQTASASAMSTAATSAASFIGSKITIASYKADQSREADGIALDLLVKLGWNKYILANSLVSQTKFVNDDNWSKDFLGSAQTIASLAATFNSITGLKANRDDNGNILVTVEMSMHLDNLPARFTTDEPPRIVFDFDNTTNNLGKSVQSFAEMNLLSSNIVQTAQRTRLVLNLERTRSFDTRIDGKRLLISLQDNVAGMAILSDASNIIKTDPVLKQPVLQ